MNFDELTAEQQLDAVRKTVADYQSSKRLNAMLECCAYYETENPAIMRRRKFYASYDDDEQLAVAKENRFASNMKVCSSFFRDITDGKVQYLAGEGADITPATSDEAAAANVQTVTDSLARTFRRAGQACLCDALVSGRGYGYLQVLNGVLELSHIEATECIPQYDRTGQLVELVRYYKRGHIEYAEWHTAAHVYTFVRDSKAKRKGWQAEGVRWQIQTITVYGDGTKVPTNGKAWPVLPWFEMRANDSGRSSLTHAAKSMIDCYDFTMSDFANNLLDVQDVYINVKDTYSAGGMDYGETMDMLKTFKLTEGDTDVTTIDIPYQARQVLLTAMKADIYAGLRGVDVGRISSGQLTNTAIRALYSDIDNWADQAEWHLADWCESIVNAAAGYLGITLPQVNITFSRNMIINEADELQSAAMQKGIVSDLTLLQHHPWVQDAQQELERVQLDGLPADDDGAII